MLISSLRLNIKLLKEVLSRLFKKVLSLLYNLGYLVFFY
jgi:hypothetical protein